VKGGPALIDPAHGRDWVADAEAILKQMRDIEHAAIATEGDEIREVHVVARTTRRPKQIVRDVESALSAFLRRSIDHRVISVVLVEGPPARARSPELMAPPPPPPPAPEPPPRERAAGARESATANPSRALSPPGPDERVRFVSANLIVSGLRTQAQVELSWQGVTRLGSATGVSLRANAERLTAQAALQALQPFLGEQRALALDDVAILRAGRQDVVVVTVKLLEQRRERSLTGSCTLEQDVPQSVVYATLSALNRILGAVGTREPIEYELRPAST
jgi:hypothetical protein